MSAYFLNGTSNYPPDLSCPHCNEPLEIERIEEPYDGEWEMKNCPKCGKQFKITTNVNINYHVESLV